MYPLIEIKTVPIEITMKTKHATMTYTNGTAEMEISRSEGGGLNIKSRPVRLNIDTFEARNSIRPTPTRAVEQAADSGKQAAYKATATYARHGDLFINAAVKDPIGQISREITDKNIDRQSEMVFLPSTGPEIEWEDGAMEIRYEMDKLNFDWKLESGEFKFTPGDIEFSVEQRGEVIIKYVGGPLYVPPSADPNYEPVDVKA